MPTNKPQFSMVMDEDLLRIIEEFKVKNHLRSRTKAANILLQAGIEAVLEETKSAAPSGDPDKAAQGESGDTAEVLRRALTRLGVIRPGEDITERDRLFLEAMFSAIKAHFQN